MNAIIAQAYNEALQFAVNAHGTQTRKYTGLPYYTHLIEVAHIAYYSMCDDLDQVSQKLVVQASVLHDTVEDTDTRYVDLLDVFGKPVADLVVELTDRFTSTSFPNLNRHQRKTREAQRLGGISSLGKSIKCADLVSNTRSIAHFDPTFAVTYLREKEQALIAMYETGGIHQKLYEHARTSLNTSKKLLRGSAAA